MTTNNIVKNASKGYGYTYSNLADLAKAGIEIPVMKTQKVDGDEYVFAKIGDDWVQGAKVIEIDMKGMNACQAYGSALTYARRYTVQMVMGIACDDDDAIEKHADAKPVQKKTYSGGLDFEEIEETLKAIDSLASVDEYARELAKKHANLTEKQRYIINTKFNARREELKQ